MSLKALLIYEFDLSWDHSPFTWGEFFASIVDLADYLIFSREVGRRVGGKGDFDAVYNNHLVVNPGTWNLSKGDLFLWEKVRRAHNNIL